MVGFAYLQSLIPNEPYFYSNLTNIKFALSFPNSPRAKNLTLRQIQGEQFGRMQGLFYCIYRVFLPTIVQ